MTFEAKVFVAIFFLILKDKFQSIKAIFKQVYLFITFLKFISDDIIALNKPSGLSVYGEAKQMKNTPFIMH